jgi:DNA-binding XRE family transcriptional regulator
MNSMTQPRIVLRTSPAATLLVIGLLFTQSTSNNVGLTVTDEDSVRVSESTNSGTNEVQNIARSYQLRELRSRTGLNWDHLASLFDVSRRSIHAWANGGAMRSEHSHMLSRLLAFARHVDRGLPSVTKAALLTPGPTGELPFDALVRRDFSSAIEAMRAVSQPEGRVELPVMRPLRAHQSSSRLADLVGISHDPIPGTATIGRPAKARRS